MTDASIDPNAPNAILFTLLHFPLTDGQIAHILGTDEEGIRAGIAALAAKGREVERPDVTFESQIKCWNAGLVDEYRYILFRAKESGHDFGYYGTMRDVIYADRLAPIDERIRSHEPAFRAMTGYTRSPYTRLLRWLRFVGYNYTVCRGVRVVNVQFWPDLSVNWEWPTAKGHLSNSEDAFAWGIEWVANRFRDELGFSLHEDTEKRLQAIIDERFPEKSAGRRHIALLMAHESVESVRAAGKLPFRDGIAGKDSLPACIIRTCDILCRNEWIQEHLLVSTRAEKETGWMKIPPPATANAAPAPVFDGDPKDRKTDELEISVRSANALSGAGIETVGQLIEETEAGLRKKKFWKKSLAEIKEVLAEMGLSLKQPDA